MLSYGNCSYAYKMDGSLQSKTCPDGTTTYDYDAFGNLRHVGLPNGTAVDYVIDGQNRRVGKKVNGVMMEGFLYRGQLRPSAWLGSDGITAKAVFVYGLKANVTEYIIQGGASYRLITDQIGSVRLVENVATGAIAERIDYDEFGNVLTDSAHGTQPFGFAGGFRDVGTALTRLGARDYDPATGRWTAKDALRFAGMLANLYGYVGGDPVNSIDPTGHLRLPAGGTSPGPDWFVDPSHQDPNGVRWRHPNGDYADFHQGRPGERGWRGKDHWHHNGSEKHYKPGDEVPDPAPVCKDPNASAPEPGVLDEAETDSDDPNDVEPMPFVPIFEGPFPAPVWEPIFIPVFP